MPTVKLCDGSSCRRRMFSFVRKVAHARWYQRLLHRYIGGIWEPGLRMVISRRFLLKSGAAPGATDVESGSSNIGSYSSSHCELVGAWTGTNWHESKYSGEGAVILAHQTGLRRLIPLVRWSVCVNHFFQFYTVDVHTVLDTFSCRHKTLFPV